METQKKELEVARRKRIDLYKKIIITILMASSLIPILFCVILVLRVNRLEKEIHLLIHEVNAEALKTNLPIVADAVGERMDIVFAAETSSDTKIDLEDLEEETGDISDKKKVYLTFDDGPSASTHKILDILDQYHVKATFFVVGRGDEISKELYKRIVDDGHTLGLHSYSHAYDEIYASKESFIADLEKLQSYLHEITGVKPTVYRFPGGSSNTISDIDIEELIPLLNEREITYFDWNVSCGDADSKQSQKNMIINNVLKDIPLFNNSVVLMHDASNKTSTVDALPEIIESILDMNYDLLPLNDTVKPVQHIKVE